MTGIRSIRCDEGFGLAEILVVLAIVGLSVGLLSSGLTSWARRNTVVSDAKEIRSMLERARYQAIFQMRNSEVTFDVGRRKITFEDEVLSIPPETTFTVAVGAITVRHGEKGSIIFRQDGSSSGGEIVLVDATAHVKILTQWITGLTRFVVDGQ